MGKINPYLGYYKELNILNLDGTVFAYVSIHTTYNQREDGALDPRLPGGPANRKVVSSYDHGSFSINFIINESPLIQRINEFFETMIKEGCFKNSDHSKIEIGAANFDESLDDHFNKDFNLKIVKR